MIDENGEKQGVMPIMAAMDAAREAGMDLVEVSPNQEVPVVKILDYGKLRFEERKKKAAAKRPPVQRVRKARRGGRWLRRGALVAVTIGLWAYFGTAVFFEMVRTGLAACF